MRIHKSGTLPEMGRVMVHSTWFQRFVVFTIILAGVLAGIETDAGMVAAYGPVLRTLDALVLGIFIFEALAKLVSKWPRPLDYFRDGWNVFDFMIIVVCLLPLGSQFAMVMRLGRTLRLLRLLSALPKLQLLVGALIKSFSSMGYVGLLLGLMVYIYAIIGIHLFGAHDKEHFGSLPAAFLTLFQTITLDDWKFLFVSAQGSSPAVAAVYFISFILLGTMIMLNLFIGIIMNGMEEMHAELDESKAAKQQGAGKGGVMEDLTALEAQLASLQAGISDLRAKLQREP